ncbi:MAG: uroporphyrinogen-III C-methyltransferase [Endomicrobiales bacterium]|nr:uroporphyrinogen-III C-methyltransferase [Endomicrobiales bacterium]
MENKTKSTWLVLFIIILLFVAGVSGYVWYQANQQTPAQPQTTTYNQLQAKVNQQQLEIQTLQNMLQKTTTASMQQSTEVKLIEIEYLMHMANLILETSQNLKDAEKFLLLAKEYAAAPEFTMLHSALTKDILSVQNTPSVDIEGAMLRLEIATKQVTNLTLFPEKTLDNKNTCNNTVTSPANNLTQNIWQKSLHNVKNALARLVVIRHQAVEPLPDPNQINIIKINIQTKLQEAEWALLHKQNRLYKAALLQAIDWVKRYFATSNQTQMLLNNLQELRGLDLEIQLPTLVASFAALHNVTQDLSRQQTAETKQPTQTTAPSTTTPAPTPAPVPTPTPSEQGAKLL